MSIQPENAQPENAQDISEPSAFHRFLQGWPTLISSDLDINGEDFSG